MKRLENKDRINVFYIFEQHAKDPKTAGNLFLLVPHDPERPDAQTQWTYAEAYETVLKYAAWLKTRHSVQKEELIAMDFTNKPQFIWFWFALWSLGAIPAFINSNLRDKAFTHSIRISTSRLLLIDPQIREVLNEETKSELGADQKGQEIDMMIIEPEVEQQILAQTPYRAADSARSGAKINSCSLLIYTSGTTGLPKAANVSWSKPLSGVAFFAKLLELKPTDRYFTALPLYHSSGSVLGVLQVLGPGCTSVVGPKFSPRTFMKWISETQSDGIHYIGEMCRYLVSSPPTPYDRAHKARFAFGNGMRLDVWQRFKDRFNIGTIIEFYGATEGTAASYVHSRNNYLRGAISKQGVILRNLLNTFIIVKHDHATDEPYRNPKNSFCVKCKADEPGELIHPLDPENIAEKYQGYFGNDKASDSKILRDVFKKGDAYYRTGDLVRRDAEGRIWFTDRVGDTFRWKSENVSTAEVSEAIGSHPDVREANVYGVQLPNHDGRAGCAAIVVSDDTLSTSLALDLANHSRKRLPRYAVPLFLRLMKQVEVTGTLKHQKVALRNEGVDPSKLGQDEVFWLESGDEGYKKFGEKDWQRIVDGSAKL
ncbi:long-chain fatty acid transporter fat1 [Vermiconidia calcicola]|uniref:Long-chain fatty acid transporter fat1 n=1 Tax=Vermiconidia calcicola TaxID=1690605 RepID=A0ACC3NNW6_9PEZI|nr:long-chain fatty acid transporter fat1 [Vermiconidia calcicola]